MVKQLIPLALDKISNHLDKWRMRYFSTPAAMIDFAANRVVVSRAIFTFAHLNLADHLKSKPQSVEDLATQVNAAPFALKRLLDFLVSVGFLKLKNEKYDLTSASTHLLSGPRSLSNWVQYVGADWQMDAWRELPETIQKGQTYFEQKFNLTFFDWLTQNPGPSTTFNNAMVSRSQSINESIINAFDFSKSKILVEIAAGHGAFTRAVLKDNPHLSGQLFDQAHVIEEAKTLLSSDPLAPRLDFLKGDFLQAIPKGGDVYVLRHILHNWSDDKAIEILQNCRKALSPNAKLLIIEMLTNQGASESFIRSMDMAMLLLLGGQERSAEEYHKLLTRAGFKMNRIIRTKTPMSVIEAEIIK